MFMTKLTNRNVPVNRMTVENKNLFFRRTTSRWGVKGSLAYNPGYLNTGRDSTNGRFTSPSVAILQQS